MRPASSCRPTPARAARRLFTLPLVLLLAGALPAFGQDPTVTAAVPDTTEQETYDLVVTISGTNFGTDSVVDFYVTGTSDPGGITVKKVRRRNPKTLEATIDVAADAQTQYRFDIQVRTGGRTGKGTELFKVLEKVVGPDSTPPAAVSDLTVVGGEATRTPDGDYEALLTWSAPFDDHGAVFEYQASARPGESYTLADWDRYWPYWFSSADRPDGSPPAVPGSPDFGAVRALAPDTLYTVVLRSADAAGNWSDLSNPVTFFTGPPAPSDWGVDVIDACPPGEPLGIEPNLAVGSDGSLAVFYRRNCSDAPAAEYVVSWVPASGWSTRRPIDFGHDPYLALAIDPADGRPTILSADYGRSTPLSLHRWTGAHWQADAAPMDIGTWPVGGRALVFRSGAQGAGPVAAYRAPAKGGTAKIRLAIWNGQAWEKHELASTASRGDVLLALDADGRPAVAYLNDANRDGWGDTTMFALWTGSAWQVETVEVLADPASTRPHSLSLAWNSARGEFWIAQSNQFLGSDTGEVRVCAPSGAPGAWSCSRIPEPAPFVGTALDFDAQGTAFLRVNAWDEPVPHNGVVRLRLWSRDTLDPASVWAAETAEWDADGGWFLRVDPTTGQPVTVCYASFHPTQSLRLLRRLP